MTTRKYSQGVKELPKKFEKPTETPKFAYTSKSKKGNSGSTFTELLKSKSEDTKDIALSPTNKDNDILPRLTLENDAHQIIREEDEGSDEEETDRKQRKEEAKSAVLPPSATDAAEEASPMPFDRSKGPSLAVGDFYEKKPTGATIEKKRNDHTFGEHLKEDSSNSVVLERVKEETEPVDTNQAESDFESDKDDTSKGANKMVYDDALLSPDIVDKGLRMEAAKSSKPQENPPIEPSAKIQREFSFNKHL